MAGRSERGDECILRQDKREQNPLELLWKDCHAIWGQHETAWHGRAVHIPRLPAKLSVFPADFVRIYRNFAR